MAHQKRRLKNERYAHRDWLIYWPVLHMAMNADTAIHSPLHSSPSTIKPNFPAAAAGFQFFYDHFLYNETRRVTPKAEQ